LAASHCLWGILDRCLAEAAAVAVVVVVVVVEGSVEPLGEPGIEIKLLVG
jgi:hypothetical protein